MIDNVSCHIYGSIYVWWVSYSLKHASRSAWNMPFCAISVGHSSWSVTLKDIPKMLLLSGGYLLCTFSDSGAMLWEIECSKNSSKATWLISITCNAPGRKFGDLRTCMYVCIRLLHQLQIVMGIGLQISSHPECLSCSVLFFISCFFHPKRVIFLHLVELHEHTCTCIYVYTCTYVVRDRTNNNNSKLHAYLDI